MSSSKPKLPVSWQSLFSLLMFGFMYLPILVLAFYSFNQSPYSAGWTGFTLDWYRKFFSDQRILSALADSLRVAFFAVGIAAIIGTLMAVGLARYRFPGKNLYRGVSYLPLIIPDIAIAVSTLVFLAAVAIPFSGGLVQLSLWTVVA
ncbi:MAG TPA: spermidine/putrescine ABC transporter permease PotC, partial [Candidatus Sericytochromatia bacterium]